MINVCQQKKNLEQFFKEIFALIIGLNFRL